MKFAMGFSQWVAALIVSLMLLTMSISFYTYNSSIYMKLYKENNVLEAAGMDEENIGKVTKHLIAYMKDDAESLDMTAVIRGENREVFNAREKAHMVDVKRLFMLSDSLKGMFIGLVLTLVGLCMWKGLHEVIYSVCVKLFAVSVLLSGSLMMIALTNFTAAFIKFHHLLFTNDLWLLDPRTDTLIQMLPEPFFRSMAIFMFGTWFGGSMVIGALGLFLRQKAI